MLPGVEIVLGEIFERVSHEIINRLNMNNQQ